MPLAMSTAVLWSVLALSLSSAAANFTSEATNAPSAGAPSTGALSKGAAPMSTPEVGEVVRGIGSDGSINTDAFTLSTLCPPSFQRDAAGGCRFEHRYQSYSSPHGAGVGGLKTGLPPIRDGFTPEQIDLGRYLFFDPALSADGSIACSSCHDPALGFSDGRARAQGIAGRVTERSAPSLWNVGFLQRLTWDGRERSLESQMQGPLYSPLEMGNSPESLLNRLRDLPAYRPLFQAAFGTQTIELEHIYTALTAFESSLISLNSRYDLYAHGIHDALSEDEIAGLNVFRSFVARCGECHTPPLFTNQQIAVLGVPERDGRSLDNGAQAISGDPSQRAGFRVPSLRNVSRTAPYMHAGNFDTLLDAVSFYNQGRGHAVPAGEDLKIHWHIWEPQLREDELQGVVLFLQTLTDEGFMPEIPRAVPSGLRPGRAVVTLAPSSRPTPNTGNGQVSLLAAEKSHAGTK